MQLTSILWEYFINFLEVLLFYFFVNTKLHLKEYSKNIRIKQYLFLLFQLFILCILNYLELSSTLTIIISWSLDIVFTLLFYSDAYIIRIFLGSMYSVICLISDYITVFIPQTFCDVDSLSILFGGKLRVPFTMLYVALIAVLVFLSSNVFDKKIQLSTVQKIAYFLVSVGGITIGHYMMLVTLEAEEKIYNSIFVFKLTMINLCFLLLFIFLLLNIYQLGYSKAMNTELLEQQKQYELEEQNYKILLHTTESLREIKHDINIHLDMIQSLLASENLDELKTYVESYHHALFKDLRKKVLKACPFSGYDYAIILNIFFACLIPNQKFSFFTKKGKYYPHIPIG